MSHYFRGRRNLLSSLLISTLLLCGTAAFADDEEQAPPLNNETILEDLNQAIEANPVDPVLYFKRGNAWGNAGQPEKAIADYNKAIELNPKFAAPYTNRGNKRISLGLYTDAIADLTLSAELDPRDPDALFYRAIAYEHLGLDKDALADFDKTLKISPKYSKTYGNRGFFLEHQGQTDRAIDDYTKAIELSPAVSRNYNNRGHAWFTKGKYDRALADMDKAIELNPDNAKAYRNRAEVQLALGEYDKAMADASRSIEIIADDSKAFLIRSETRRAMGDSAGANADKERAQILGLRPPRSIEAPVSQEILAREKFAQKAFLAEDAPETRGALAKVRYDHAFAILNNPWMAAKKAWLEEAVGYSKSAEALEPKNAAPAFLTGLLFHELAKSDKKAIVMAEQSLRHAVVLDPEYAPAWLELGLMMMESERSWEAMTAIEQALRNDPMKTAMVAIGPLTAMYAINDEGARGLAFFRELYTDNPEVSALGIGVAIMLDHQGDKKAALEQVLDLMLVEVPGTLVHNYAAKLAAEWGRTKS
jgi:tetratricopeptide (TPR) repeat protein